MSFRQDDNKTNFSKNDASKSITVYPTRCYYVLKMYLTLKLISKAFTETLVSTAGLANLWRMRQI